MFNDERINLTSGKIYRNTIIFSTLYSLFYLIFISIYNFSIANIINPAITFLTGMICFIYGECILHISEKKDDRYEVSKSNYYYKSFLIFLINIFLGFAITIAIFFRFPSNIAPNNYLLNIEILNFIFLAYQFKKNDINFNYSFIALDNHEYYKCVLNNILKILIFTFFAYILIFIISIFFYFQAFITFGITFLVAALISFFSLAILYFILSWIEKVLYNEYNDYHSYSKSLLIIFLFFVFFTILLNLTNLYMLMVSTGDIKVEVESLGAFISKLSLQSNYYSYYTNGFLALAFCNLLLYFKKDKSCHLFIQVLIFIILTQIIYNELAPLVLSTHMSEQMILLLMKIRSIIATTLTYIYNIFMLLLAIFMVKNLRFSVWIIVYSSLAIFVSIIDLIDKNSLYLIFPLWNIISAIILTLIMIKVKGKISI